jgi:uncharacterized repeat protein (TIGR02543 family)
MKKRKTRMWFLTAALILIIAAILAVTCKSPVSSEPGKPVQQPRPGIHDVTYFGNNNTAGETPVDTTKYVPGKDKVTLPDRNDLYRVGYSFTGWNTKADGSGTQYKANDQFVMEKGPVQLYAQWEEVFPRISAGESFTALVTREGILYAAGKNENGRLGDGTTTNRYEFTAVNTTNINEPVQWVSSGMDHSFAILQSGGIVGWGNGEWGKLGFDQESTVSLIPKAPSFSSTIGIGSPGKIQAVSAGRYQTAFLNDKGEYWATGTRNSGALGNGEGAREKQFKFVRKNIHSVAAGQNYILLADNGGTMWIAGEGGSGRLGTMGTNNVPKLRENIAAGNRNVTVFAGKINHSMVLQKDGRILSAGNNNYGQLGHGDTANGLYFSPVVDTEDTELTDVAFASLGEDHSMILKKDGTLWAMGRNGESQLGISGPNQLKAVKVLDNVAYAAAGYNHTMAVKEDGTLWAAGANQSGQFGQKTSTSANNLWTEIDISKILNPAAPPVP